MELMPPVLAATGDRQPVLPRPSDSLGVAFTSPAFEADSIGERRRVSGLARPRASLPGGQ